MVASAGLSAKTFAAMALASLNFAQNRPVPNPGMVRTVSEATHATKGQRARGTQHRPDIRLTTGPSRSCGPRGPFADSPQARRPRGVINRGPRGGPLSGGPWASRPVGQITPPHVGRRGPRYPLKFRAESPPVQSRRTGGSGRARASRRQSARVAASLGASSVHAGGVELKEAVAALATVNRMLRGARAQRA
jgi:hypothetical protein